LKEANFNQIKPVLGCQYSLWDDRNWLPWVFRKTKFNSNLSTQKCKSMYMYKIYMYLYKL
jgi:hypothetical protein